MKKPARLFWNPAHQLLELTCQPQSLVQLQDFVQALASLQQWTLWLTKPVKHCFSVFIVPKLIFFIFFKCISKWMLTKFFFHGTKRGLDEMQMCGLSRVWISFHLLFFVYFFLYLFGNNPETMQWKTSEKFLALYSECNLFSSSLSESTNICCSVNLDKCRGKFTFAIRAGTAQLLQTWAV